jgi:hypothetical protein
MSALARKIQAKTATRWRRIRQSGHLERERELRDAASTADQDRINLEADQANARKQFSSTQSSWFSSRPEDEGQIPKVEYYHEIASRATNIAGICVTLLEAIFAGALSVLWLALAWYWAVAIGVAITILIAVAAKGVIAPLVTGRYADRPKAARDPVLLVLAILGPAAMIMLGIGFFARGAELNWLDNLFPWDMGALAIVLPIVAGALFTLSELFGWSTRQVAEYRELETAKNDVTQLHDFCTREIAKLPPK